MAHNEAGLLNAAGKAGVLRQETVAGMDQLDVVLQSNLDDLIASQVRADGCVLATLANDVGLVGLCSGLDVFSKKRNE